MRLYLANPTRQEQIICYRVDFNKDGERLESDRTRFQPARQQPVPPGRQIQLGGDMHIHQIEDIIEQLKPYGLIGVTDVPRMDRKVVPYIFNIDAYVPLKTFKEVMDHNSGIHIQDGQHRRAAAAVASSELVQQTIANQLMQVGIEQPPAEAAVEVSYEQLEQSEAGERTIAEGYRVDPNAPGPQQAPRRGGGRPKGSRNKPK
jgi:hypothetical protein